MCGIAGGSPLPFCAPRYFTPDLKRGKRATFPWSFCIPGTGLRGTGCFLYITFFNYLYNNSVKWVVFPWVNWGLGEKVSGYTTVSSKFRKIIFMENLLCTCCFVSIFISASPRVKWSSQKCFHRNGTEELDIFFFSSFFRNLESGNQRIFHQE